MKSNDLINVSKKIIREARILQIKNDKEKAITILIKEVKRLNEVLYVRQVIEEDETQEPEN